jgi:hypothetical protein
MVPVTYIVRHTVKREMAEVEGAQKQTIVLMGVVIFRRQSR